MKLPFFSTTKGDILMIDNGKIYRLGRIDGTPMDSSQVSGLTAGRISIGADCRLTIKGLPLQPIH